MNTDTKYRQIDLYFDPVSPYVWLAATQLDNLIVQTDAQIIAKPILFAGLLKAHGHKGPAEIPVKRIYTFADVMRRALKYGVNIEGPPTHPFNPLLALRVLTAIEEDELRLTFAKSVLNAAWSRGVDITQSETIAALATDCDIDPAWAIAVSQDPAIKTKLANETQKAIDLGVFGVPTFRIDEQLFWGEDRIVDLVHYINGNHIDQEKLKVILNRESGVKKR